MPIVFRRRRAENLRSWVTTTAFLALGIDRQNIVGCLSRLAWSADQQS